MRKREKKNSCLPNYDFSPLKTIHCRIYLLQKQEIILPTLYVWLMRGREYMKTAHTSNSRSYTACRGRGGSYYLVYFTIVCVTSRCSLLVSRSKLDDISHWYFRFVDTFLIMSALNADTDWDKLMKYLLCEILEYCQKYTQR